MPAERCRSNASAFGTVCICLACEELEAPQRPLVLPHKQDRYTVPNAEAERKARPVLLIRKNQSPVKEGHDLFLLMRKDMRHFKERGHENRIDVAIEKMAEMGTLGERSRTASAVPCDDVGVADVESDDEDEKLHPTRAEMHAFPSFTQFPNEYGLNEMRSSHQDMTVEQGR